MLIAIKSGLILAVLWWQRQRQRLRMEKKREKNTEIIQQQKLAVMWESLTAMPSNSHQISMPVPHAYIPSSSPLAMIECIFHFTKLFSRLSFSALFSLLFNFYYYFFRFFLWMRHSCGVISELFFFCCSSHSILRSFCTFLTKLWYRYIWIQLGFGFWLYGTYFLPMPMDQHQHMQNILYRSTSEKEQQKKHFLAPNH